MVTYTWSCNQCGASISVQEHYFADSPFIDRVEQDFREQHQNHKMGI